LGGRGTIEEEIEMMGGSVGPASLEISRCSVQTGVMKRLANVEAVFGLVAEFFSSKRHGQGFAKWVSRRIAGTWDAMTWAPKTSEL